MRPSAGLLGKPGVGTLGKSSHGLEKPSLCPGKTEIRHQPEGSHTQRIKRNAREYLNPPITNVGYKGILKTAAELIKWFETSKNVEEAFRTTALLMEKAGTGGALFRNLYRDFPGESGALLRSEKLMDAHEVFQRTAILRSSISRLLDKAGKTKSLRHVEQAADILREASGKEKRAMEPLASTD